MLALLETEPSSGQYIAGDTVWLRVAVPDTDGVNIAPSALRVLIKARGDHLDSSRVIGSGLTKDGNHEYDGSYIIPASFDLAYRTQITFLCRYTGGGFLDNLFPGVSPRSITVGGAVVDSVTSSGNLDINTTITELDSITPNAVKDLWIGVSDNTSTIITESDGGTVTFGGSPVSGAAVWVFSDSVSLDSATLEGYDGRTDNGNYDVRVDISPTAIDTFYVFASTDGGRSWLPVGSDSDGKRVIIP